MKSMLHLKFIALYIIFGFLCLFTTATLTTQLVEDQLAVLRQQMYDQMLEMEQEAIGWPQSATVERGA